MITRFDHIAVVVRDFDRTVRNYEILFGRRPSWRGVMPGSQHAWFAFGDMALDVIAAKGVGPQADALRAHIEKYGEGIWGVGLSVPKLAEAVHLFERRGLSFQAAHIARTKNEEGQERAWHVQPLTRKATHGAVMFLVEDGGHNDEIQPVSDGVETLDHIVVSTLHPERAVALYGGRLGLDLRLDRVNAQWGARQLFFRCGNAILEIAVNLNKPVSDAPDTFGGLAWRVKNSAQVHARVSAAGLSVSDRRPGRKPGTEVFTVREGTGGIATLILAQS